MIESHPLGRISHTHSPNSGQVSWPRWPEGGRSSNPLVDFVRGSCPGSHTHWSQHDYERGTAWQELGTSTTLAPMGRVGGDGRRDLMGQCGVDGGRYSDLS